MSDQERAVGTRLEREELSTWKVHWTDFLSDASYAGQSEFFGTSRNQLATVQKLLTFITTKPRPFSYHLFFCKGRRLVRSAEND